MLLFHLNLNKLEFKFLFFIEIFLEYWINYLTYVTSTVTINDPTSKEFRIFFTTTIYQLSNFFESHFYIFLYLTKVYQAYADERTLKQNYALLSQFPRCRILAYPPGRLAMENSFHYVKMVSLQFPFQIFCFSDIVRIVSVTWR